MITYHNTERSRPEQREEIATICEQDLLALIYLRPAVLSRTANEWSLASEQVSWLPLALLRIAQHWDVLLRQMFKKPWGAYGSHCLRLLLGAPAGKALGLFQSSRATL